MSNLLPRRIRAVAALCIFSAVGDHARPRRLVAVAEVRDHARDVHRPSRGDRAHAAELDDDHGGAHDHHRRADDDRASGAPSH